MALSSDYIEKLKTEGYEANLKGLFPDDNPYQNEDTRAAWQAGYNERDDHITDMLMSAHSDSFEMGVSGFIVLVIVISLIFCIINLIWS